jgi:hypothetical protein
LEAEGGDLWTRLEIYTREILSSESVVGENKGRKGNSLHVPILT